MDKKTWWLVGIMGIAFFTYALAETIVRIAPLTYSIKSSVVTVTDTATALPTTALVGRENITIRNLNSSSTTLYIGGSDVTSANGYPLDSSSPGISLDLDDSVVVYGIVASGTAPARVLEVK